MLMGPQVRESRPGHLEFLKICVSEIAEENAGESRNGHRNPVVLSAGPARAVTWHVSAAVGLKRTFLPQELGQSLVGAHPPACAFGVSPRARRSPRGDQKQGGTAASRAASKHQLCSYDAQGTTSTSTGPVVTPAWGAAPLAKARVSSCQSPRRQDSDCSWSWHVRSCSARWGVEPQDANLPSTRALFVPHSSKASRQQGDTAQEKKRPDG